MGGGERTRTADFYVANVALYQLSYTPGQNSILPAKSVPGVLIRLNVLVESCFFELDKQPNVGDQSNKGQKSQQFHNSRSHQKI